MERAATDWAKRFWAVTAAFAIVVAVLLGWVTPASAHASAIQTEPSTGSTIASSPTRILVRFSTPIEVPLNAMRLVDGKGANVAIGAAEHPEGEKNAVSAPVSGLPDGGYVAIYQVIAADGHTTRGAFTFQIGATSTPVDGGLVRRLSESGESGTLRFLSGLARMLMYSGVMISLGGYLFVRRCWPDGLTNGRAHRALTVAALVALVASVSLMAFAAATASGRGLAGVSDTTGWRSVLASHAGRWWIVRSLGVLVLVGAIVRRVPGRLAAGLAAVGGALIFVGMSKGGHGTSGRWPLVGVSATIVHLAAGSAWVGGLVVALVALSAGASRDILKRFSNIALVSVIALVGSGAAQSARQLLDWSGWDTAYGHNLRSKLVVVAVLIAIGGVSRFLLRRETSGIRSVDVVGLEVLFAAGVLALTMTLINTPPPAPAAAKSFTTKMVVGNRTADIIVEPAGQGANTIHVTVTNNDGSIRNPSGMTVRLSLPTKDIPAITADPTQRLANHASFENLIIPLPGEWKVEIIVTYNGETVRFSTPVKIR